MRNFKKLKAKELYETSLKLDEQANIEAEKELIEFGYTLGDKGYSGSIAMHIEAAGLRVLADDIEDGLIDECEI